LFWFQTLAVASPTNPSPPATTLCCNSVQQSNSADAAGALAAIGIILNAVVPIGLGCSPITVLGNNWYVFCPAVYPLLNLFSSEDTQVTCNSPQQQIGSEPLFPASFLVLTPSVSA
jgi:hypothetical protein